MSKPTLPLLRILAAACLSAIALLTSCGRDQDVAEGLDHLAARFRQANQADTINPMLELYCLKGCDNLITDRLKGALTFELGLPIEQIQFETLSGATEETIEFSYNGTAYGPTLPPQYKMRVTYDVEDRLTSLFTVGQSPTGEWKIISAKPKPPLRY